MFPWTVIKPFYGSPNNVTDQYENSRNKKRLRTENMNRGKDVPCIVHPMNTLHYNKCSSFFSIMNSRETATLIIYGYTEF